MKPTLMIIDDNEDITDLLGHMLRRAGYTVLIAATGAEALKLFASLIVSPDFILLDVQLPDTSGPELLDQIEEEFPAIFKNTPIMYYTAGDPPKDERVFGTLNKMLDVHQILAQLKDRIPA